MWIFCQKGFLSVVAHNTKPDILVVRSRFEGHIQKVFPKARVEEDATRDYRFRTELHAREVAKVISRLVSEISYDNFKGSLDMNDEKYLDCCVDVYNSVARNSGDLDLENFIYGRRRADGSKQVKG